MPKGSRSSSSTQIKYNFSTVLIMSHNYDITYTLITNAFDHYTASSSMIAGNAVSTVSTRAYWKSRYYIQQLQDCGGKSYLSFAFME